MENFDFHSNDKLAVFFTYKLKPKKYIFTNILGNLIFSFFIIAYVYRIFTWRKNFEKYMMLILELFNGLLTLFYMSLYLRLSSFSNLQSMRIIYFYFYYYIFYLVLYLIYTIDFFVVCLQKKVKQAAIEGWEFGDVLLVFSPIIGIFILKVTQHVNYYFAYKLVEDN